VPKVLVNSDGQLGELNTYQWEANRKEKWGIESLPYLVMNFDNAREGWLVGSEK